MDIRLSFSFILLILLCFAGNPLSASAQRLPPDEVAILKTIASKMNNTYWDITEDSCFKDEWKQKINELTQTNVTCNCSFSNGSVCHVTKFLFKGFSVNGILPEEFGNLTYLEELDLTRNFLNGTIPKAITRLPQIRILAFLGNRLSGSIPKELGDVETLEELVLENNLFGGTLPEELGNLANLKRLLLSANNFTGKIPDSFGKLKSLNDFRVDGTQLSGSVPGFIGNWTNLTRLDLQGTSMSGPIPTSLSLLTNLQELRITDLGAPVSNFPNLSALTNMEQLVLRNCRINSSIPTYFGSMTNLKRLDLSNNRLTDEIPSALQGLDSLNYLMLNNNSLTGAVPSWVVESEKSIDCSYNNFTSTRQNACDLDNINLISSSSSPLSDSVPWCTRKGLPCRNNNKRSSVSINCGGGKTEDYEEDLNSGGSSKFKYTVDWGFSSTGSYLGTDKTPFIASNSFNFTLSKIYSSARLAPQSLRYFAFCLRQGSYKVQLHFAEIMFSNDSSFRSLGRRVFNVAIQGEEVLSSFDIAKEAGGVGIGINRTFDTLVNDSTLEIHLYWLGKGTNAIPDRGVYGPLISAISITPNYKIDDGDLSSAAIAGIVAGSVVVLALFLLILWRFLIKSKDPEDKELQGLDLLTGHFTLRQIKRATGNFDPANKIGEGGFGPVYKGTLSDGGTIAVKQLSSKSKQGNREFVNEIGMISALQHPNLVRLYGCCTEGNQLLLVYEYMDNNSLARALFGKESERLSLNWQTRKKILFQIAKGLVYLHEESRLKIVHRDIKATNVLLDKDLNAKISDFGLAKLSEDENTHISTRIAGTIGYMAPEYAMRGYLTDKADVYSFGVVALEMVSGKSNTNYRPKEDFIYLLDWAYVLEEQGNLLELVDPAMPGEYPTEEARRILNLALLCTNPSPTLRPRMSQAVKMMEGEMPVQAPRVVRGGGNDEAARFKAFEMLSGDSQAEFRESWVQGSSSSDGPFLPSSSSASFLPSDRSRVAES